MDCRTVPSAWDELLRTASAVRATTTLTSAAPSQSGRLRRAVRPIAMTAALLTAGAFAVAHLAGTTRVVSANSGEDSRLFALTNQYRTSNGVHSLAFSSTLQRIGENAPYNCNGITVYGRSYDMIHRNYFAHLIPGCGQYVFSMMQAFGVHYRSAGENIGWESGASDPAGYINGRFLGSPEHLANIRNPNYTEMGVGSDEGAYWTGVGSQQNVWMFSEEFAQVGSSPPPRPGPRPRPPGPRNSPHPAPPGAAPLTTGPKAEATPTGLPIPFASLPANLPAPPISQYEGLLPNSIESVLEAFLSL
jgi:uncharacterized protein YkwD